MNLSQIGYLETTFLGGYKMSTNNNNDDAVYSIALSLVETGLNELDIFNLASAIQNQEIHSALTGDVRKNFKETVAENRKIAFRRTFGKNAVVFGPNGIAVIERDEVLFCFPYKKGEDGRSSFEAATMIHGDFIVYNNDSVTSLNYDNN